MAFRGLLGTAAKYIATQVLKGAAAYLTTPDDLQVLTISLNVAASDPAVDFCLEINPWLKAASSQPVQNWRVPASVFRVSERFEPGQQELMYSLEFPTAFIEELSRVLPPEHSIPLWVRFGPVAGYLRMMPWDRMFSTRLKRPVLWLTDLESPPPRELEETLHVVLCASEPKAKFAYGAAALLPKIVKCILESNAREKILVHVYTDKDKYDQLRLALVTEVSRGVLIVHNPSELADVVSFEPKPALSSPVQNVWLRWVLQLRHPIDVVHFICHGYLATEQGWIAFAESPTKNIDEAWSRFVGGAELNDFFVQSGAWSVAFSSPTINFSKSALRLLANQISEGGRRSSILHDIAEDQECTELKQAYKFLYAQRAESAPVSSALSIYCHPNQVQVDTKAKYLVRKVSMALPDQFGFTISEDVTEQLAEEFNALLTAAHGGRDLPPWLAATQRYIEERSLDIRRLERNADNSPEQQEQIERAKQVLIAIHSTAITLATSGGEVP